MAKNTVAVRFKLKKIAHKKLKQRQIALTYKKNKFVTMEDALHDLILNSK